MDDKEKLKLIEEGLTSFWSQFEKNDIYSQLTIEILLEEIFGDKNEKTSTNS